MRSVELNEERYLSLLGKCIGEVKNLQNRPPTLVPQESLVGNHVEAHLKPYLTTNGGPLTMERVEYAPGRNNIIITYPGETDTCLSFVGSHMDVVPANPEEWDKDPYNLVKEGDILYGRGVTDCLGHVALITELLVELATQKPKLKTTIVVVFIANEENSDIPDIGVDGLIKNGKLNHLKKGYMYWIDASDTNPCIGTAACVSWKLKAQGLMGHSGLPHKAVNALYLGYEAVSEICNKVHTAFPPLEKEADYKFACPTNMKLTMVEHPPGAVNQIPGQATFQGDIRINPFYKVEDVMKKTLEIVEEVKKNILSLPGKGPKMAYQVGEQVGSIDFTFSPGFYRGIACNIESPGFIAFNEATKEVVGESVPYSIGGSLPLVYELQQEGYDLQVAGYGLSAKYHGVNEYAKLSDMAKGFKIFQTLINKLNK